MCDPITAVAAGSMIGGGIMKSGAAKAGRKAQQRALDAAVGVSRAEYDKRNATSREGSKTQLDLDRAGFDEGNALDKEIGDELTRIADTGYRADIDSERRMIERDAASRMTEADARQAYADGRLARAAETGETWTGQLAAENDARRTAWAGEDEARRGVWTAEDQARAEYDARIEAERAKQAGYRGQATVNLADALRGLSFETAEAGRVTDAGARGGFTTAAITAPAAGAPNGMTGLVAEEAARRAAAGNQTARTQATAGANLDSYGGMVRTGGKVLVDLGDRLALVDNSARLSASALPAELMAAVTRRDTSRDLGDLLFDSARSLGERRYANAGARGDAQRGLISLANENALIDTEVAGTNDASRRRISGVRRSGERAVNNQYTDDMGRAVEGSGQKRRASLTDYYTRRVGSEDDFTRALLASSGGYEEKMTGLTNYKIANTSTSSPLGSLLTQLGSTGMSIGMNGGWDKARSWMKG